MKTTTTTRTIHVRGSIHATVVELTAREITSGDVVIFGQKAVRVSIAEYVGNHGVKRIKGHTGGLGFGISEPFEDYLPKNTPIYLVTE